MRKILIIALIIMALGMMYLSTRTKQITPKPIIQETYTIEADSVSKPTTMAHFTPSGLYNLRCKLCHGNYGKGDGVKARFDTTLCPYDLSKVTKPDKEVYYIIYDGKERMPDQHKLSDSAVQIIVVYIKKFKNINE